MPKYNAILNGTQSINQSQGFALIDPLINLKAKGALEPPSKVTLYSGMKEVTLVSGIQGNFDESASCHCV